MLYRFGSLRALLNLLGTPLALLHKMQVIGMDEPECCPTHLQARQQIEIPSSTTKFELVVEMTRLPTPYNIGQVASEYIIASVGFQKMLDIFIDFGTSKNFEKSFEKVTGISKTSFYEKFDQIRTNVGLPAITWKLDGLINKKIGG
jgi:hypothetical protein